jgi:hypothetical protein
MSGTTGAKAFVGSSGWLADLRAYAHLPPENGVGRNRGETCNSRVGKACVILIELVRL